jgi:hypothetical protein
MTWPRAILAWLLLLVVAFANGTVRQLAYPASLGDFAARQVSTVVGAVALGLTMWLVLRRWPVPGAARAWGVGALWALLTVAFEVAMMRGAGRPWGEVAAQYALWEGSLWPLLVLWILVGPRVLSRQPGPSTPR